MVIVFQLFRLQVLHGAEYRDSSQRRLFRNADIKASRGEIFDRNGVVLATNRDAFNIEIMKTSIEPVVLNKAILSLVQVMEKNGDTYRDNFPMSINPIRLDLRDNPDEITEGIARFYKSFKIKDKNISDKQLFDKVRVFYSISGDLSISDARKVMAIRYEMESQPLSLFDPVLVAVDVSKATVAEIEERHLDFPGVSISVEPVREYPNGSVAAHIIGYIGKINEKELSTRKEKGYDFNDIIGKSGIENTFEDLLRGQDGIRRVQMDLSGRLTDDYGYMLQDNADNMPKPGNNIYLTIDSKLQKVAEKSLEETICQINSGGTKDRFIDAQTGAVVAMDVKTGEVLALASYPAFNPNIFVKGVSKDDWEPLMDTELTPLRNRAIQGAYSPGSTFKMITAISALEEHKITPYTQIRDEGIYKRFEKSNYTPKCWIWSSSHSTHGLVNVSKAIQVSCNYFFYEVGYQTGIDNINKYAKMFGLGSKTGIELPGESKGTMAGPEYKKARGDKWYPGNTIQAAIGQSDYAFTPIQMANYVSTLVNGCIRNRPHLFLKAATWDAKTVSKDDINNLLAAKLKDSVTPEVLKLDKSYLKYIFQGMESVTGDAGGTAYSTFANFPIKVAGKTGTAQVREKNKKTGKKKSDNAWFVGFAPYDDPKIAVAVIIESGGHGSYTAPIAKDIFSEYFGLNKAKTQADKNEEQNKNQND